MSNIYTHPALLKSQNASHLMALMQGPHQLKPIFNGKHILLHKSSQRHGLEGAIEAMWEKQNISTLKRLSTQQRIKTLAAEQRVAVITRAVTQQHNQGNDHAK